MIFGVLDPDKIWHALLTDLSTSHVRCSHFTLGSPKSHFQQYYSYILLIIYVISEENKPTCPPTWKCHHTNLQNAQFFSSDWRFVSFIQMLVPLKTAGFWLPLVALKTPGCDVWQLGCWASNVIASVQWPPSAWMHASRLFRHWSFASYTTLCWNSVHVSTSCCATRPYRRLLLNTCAAAVSCPRCSNRAVQIIGSTE